MQPSGDNFTVNDTYDSLEQKSNDNNVVINDVYDSLQPTEQKKRGNSNVMMNDTYDSLEGGRATPNKMLNDTYDSLQHQNTAAATSTALCSPIIYDAIHQPPPPQAPSLSPSDMMSGLSENEYNSLTQTIAANNQQQPSYDHLSLHKERKPRGPSFGNKAKDYSRLTEDEYATPNVKPNKGGRDKTKKNNEKKKKKKKQ